MKAISTQKILIFLVVSLILFNAGLLYFRIQDKIMLERAMQSISRLAHLKDVKFQFDFSKEITITRFKYEQYYIGNVYIYTGSDKNTLMHVHNITNDPKLVLGLNRNMCIPCIDGTLENLKDFFPDYENNPNIILIADIEERFKDNYYNKKVISFLHKEDFPLYEIETPYLFILDKDLNVKLLFIIDKTSPELTIEYLKNIRKRYLDI